MLAGGLIYWATVDSATVKMSSLDGSGRTTLLNETTTAFYTGLTLYRDALYVADDQRRSAAARIALQVTWSVRILYGWLGSRVVSVLDSGAEGPGFKSHAVATLSGNSLRQTVHARRASVHQAAKLVAALLRVARITAGLSENNGSRVYDSRHLQADCQELGSAPEPYAR